MRPRDIKHILNTAFFTALITLAFILPSSTNAGPDGSPLTKTIQDPTLIVRGVEISLASAEGGKPAFTLTAQNTTDKPAEIALELSMTAVSRPPASRGVVVSRMPALPREIWQDKVTLTLRPREARTIALATNTTLPANSEITTVLRESGTENAIVGLSFIAVRSTE
jgi:hypothetical protein